MKSPCSLSVCPSVYPPFLGLQYHLAVCASVYVLSFSFCMRSVSYRTKWAISCSCTTQTLYGHGRLGFDYRQGRELSLLHRAQTDSGAHTASYTIGIGNYL
jgi:hypothetical protein